MQNSIPYLDILIFAIIAIFLIFRLKNLLGTKTGFDKQTNDSEIIKNSVSNVVDLKSKSENNNLSKLDLELLALRQIQPDFDVNDFLNGCNSFYKMVLNSFVKGNLDEVKKFIKPAIIKNFNAAIKDRTKEEETLIIDINSFKITKIDSIDINKSVIKITVLFENYQMKALKDKNNKIIDGDLEEEILVKDIWIFQRKIDDNNPNWTLIETKSL